jgi:hypothetical protein
MNHGGRRTAQSAANIVCGLDGSNAMSIAPMPSPLNSTFCHVPPPSFESLAEMDKLWNRAKESN